MTLPYRYRHAELEENDFTTIIDYLSSPVDIPQRKPVSYRFDIVDWVILLGFLTLYAIVSTLEIPGGAF